MMMRQTLNPPASAPFRRRLCSAGLIALLSTLLIPGCGFHLRGKIIVPERLRTVHIMGTDTPLIAEVAKALRFNGSAIAADKQGVAVLDLTATTYKRTINATNSTGQATAYELKYVCAYVLLDAEGNQLQAQSIIETRDLAFDDTQILVAEREEEFLKADMQKEIASRLLQQLSKVK